MKKHMGLRGKALHASLLCTAVLPAYLLYGYNQAVAGSLLSLKSWVTQFPEIDVAGKSGSAEVFASNIQGTVVGIYTAAGIFGALFCIWCGDRYGRKKTIFIGAVAAGIGAIIQCSSYSLGQLVAGRVIAGLGNGGIVATVPNLQAECSEPAKRGGVVQYLSVFALAGLAVAGWIDLGCSFKDPSSFAWRFPLAMPIFFALLILLGLTFAPESPRWLVSAGRIDEARETFAALYDTDPNADVINTEINEIEQASNATDQHGFRHVFKMGKNRLFHRLCICCGIQTFQQLTGVNCLAYYQSKVFMNLGLGAVDSSVLAASVFTWSALVSMIGVWTVDRFGRRPLLIISVVGNGISMAVIAGCGADKTSKVALGFATLFDFLFFAFFTVGFLGVTFLYAAEIAPLSLRVPITAMSTACVWAFNFMTVEIAPVGVATISYRFYIIWAVINLFLILPCVYFLFPETKGLSLESIDRIFTESTNIFQPVHKAKELLKQGTHVSTAEQKEMQDDYVERQDSEYLEKKETTETTP